MEHEGISVIVCCYNSAQRLGPTLAHLFAQSTVGLSCEVILIDNNSTDGTSVLARDLYLESGSTIDFRVVQESEPGLIYARKKGISEAKFDILLFVDDDNWLANEYLLRVNKTMRGNRDIGILGGTGIPVFESDPPTWFHEHISSFAMGDQAPGVAGEVVEVPFVYGAGMAIGAKAYADLMSKGFQSLLVGRKGQNLSSGEDIELSYAMRFMGYKVMYDRGLDFRHVMPKGRMNWDYMMRLYKAFGKARVILEIYRSIEVGRNGDGSPWYWPIWFDRAYHLLKELLLSQTLSFRKAVWGGNEGDMTTLLSIGQLAHILALLSLRGEYIRMFEHVSKFKIAVSK